MEDKPKIHFYIISDSIGETALSVARATSVQFPNIDSVLHKYQFISNTDCLKPILDSAKEDNGIIFMTMAEIDLAEMTEKFCRTHRLTLYNLLQPITKEIERRTGLTPSESVGAQHELTDEYFQRIDAMEFAMKFDDAKNPKGFEEADIVLLGISRTSKTPLSMYLATLGYKVANLPLIPENELPQIIYKIDQKKIIGLTNDLNVIQKFRNNRMIEFGLSTNTQYASDSRIQEELEYGDKVYHELGCPVINVADRSIEETAHIIVEILNYINRDKA